MPGRPPRVTDALFVPNSLLRLVSNESELALLTRVGELGRVVDVTVAYLWHAYDACKELESDGPRGRPVASSHPAVVAAASTSRGDLDAALAGFHADLTKAQAALTEAAPQLALLADAHACTAAQLAEAGVAGGLADGHRLLAGVERELAARAAAVGARGPRAALPPLAGALADLGFCESGESGEQQAPAPAATAAVAARPRSRLGPSPPSPVDAAAAAAPAPAAPRASQAGSSSPAAKRARRASGSGSGGDAPPAPPPTQPPSQLPPTQQAAVGRGRRPPSSSDAAAGSPWTPCAGAAPGATPRVLGSASALPAPGPTSTRRNTGLPATVVARLLPAGLAGGCPPDGGSADDGGGASQPPVSSSGGSQPPPVAAAVAESDGSQPRGGSGGTAPLAASGGSGAAPAARSPPPPPPLRVVASQPAPCAAEWGAPVGELLRATQ